MSKLRDMEVVEVVNGMGKGRCIFKQGQEEYLNECYLIQWS